MEAASASKQRDPDSEDAGDTENMSETLLDGQIAEEKTLWDLSFLHRSKLLKLRVDAHSTLYDLGQQLTSASGIAPHTLRLLLPRAPALLPFSSPHSSLSISQSGITQDRVIKMMGALPVEIEEVSKEAGKAFEKTIIGFSDGDERAKRWKAGKSGQTGKLPQGNYIFCDFRTLQLPGIQLNPPAPRALAIMHRLASDPGIVAIMNKHRWRVLMMTEMAPIGYVGISPKCILGYNKNQGEEISLRLRTDDLKGFRKYESIKKTLLHELAHMVHSEHDAHFYALNKQLNEEAISLDWTKSGGQSVGGFKSAYNEEEETELTDAGGVYSSGGQKLGGSHSQLGARSAAALAALSRLSNNEEQIQSERAAEEDIVVIAEGYQIDVRLAQGQERDPDNQDLKKQSRHHISQGIDIDELFREPSNGFMEITEEDISTTRSQRCNEIGEGETRRHHDHPSGNEESGCNPSFVAATSELDRAVETKKNFQTDIEKPLEENASLKLLQESSEEACQKVNNAILKLRREASPSEAAAAIQSLYKILRNLMEHPYEEKFKRLRKANEAFQKRIARYKGAVEVLLAVGFSDDPGADSTSDFLILKRSDPVLLWLAQSSLEACMA